jgi:16S rRNA (adenine1518-N6/adenine1519-N6)-dimethyltransferase
MISPKEILKKYRIFPSKRLGQSFLIDKKVLKKIVEVADLSKNDSVLEVGPGIGNLTIELAKKVKKVIAVEKDEKMVEILKERLKEERIKNVEIVNEDILKFLPSFKLRRSYKVVANIPYYLTSRLIRNLLEAKRRPKLIVLMIQKEVAQRICAKPPKMNLLAVSVQFYAKPEIVSFVSRNCFWPRPKVDSAIIKISNIKKQKPTKEEKLFFKIVRAGFSHPRKQLINNLSKGLKKNKKIVKEWLLNCGISPDKRAENLSIEEWKRLTISFSLNPLDKYLKKLKNASGGNF